MEQSCFPQEIWLELILFSTYAKLTFIARTCKTLNRLCYLERHFELRMHKEYDNFVRLTNISCPFPYRTLYQKLKRFEIRRVKVFRIPDIVYTEQHGSVHQVQFTQDDRTRASGIALKFLESRRICLRRGDIAIMDSIKEIDGPKRYIFDGTRFELLNYDECYDGGCVPRKYAICDDDLTFGERYWEKIAHKRWNRVVYFDCDKYLDEIMENLTIQETVPKSGKNVGISSFVHSSGMRFELNCIFDDRYDLEMIRSRFESNIFLWRNFPMSPGNVAGLNKKDKDLYQNYSWIFEEEAHESQHSAYSLYLDLHD